MVTHYVSDSHISFHRATECLGSGQFGTVNKGMWQSKSSTLDVAIKTLNSSAKEMDRVKFLQEGAIMGQFKHPNVVKLHGIIKDDKTVSCKPKYHVSTKKFYLLLNKYRLSLYGQGVLLLRI